MYTAHYISLILAANQTFFSADLDIKNTGHMQNSHWKCSAQYHQWTRKSTHWTLHQNLSYKHHCQRAFDSAQKHTRGHSAYGSRRLRTFKAAPPSLMVLWLRKQRTIQDDVFFLLVFCRCSRSFSSKSRPRISIFADFWLRSGNS